MKTIKLLTLLMLVTLAMQSCRKDGDIVDITPNEPVTELAIQGSVMGTVIDENGAAIEGATVTFGNLTESTDEYGVFQFNNQTMLASGTYIKVEKEGYFKGSRKFYPTTGATSRVNVELMTMVEVAGFMSSTGDEVKFEGVEISFGNNNIMAEDGTDYNGIVKVFAKYLDPTLLATLDQMPGDLTAMNADDERVGLTTYGMIAVELRDDLGNELQVKTGMTVDVVTPVPSELLASAPERIPMWHFDEEQGTWVEEGEAILINGKYEAKLGHFSFWNYDVPSNFIHLSGSVLNRGIPVENLFIKITNTSNGSAGSGYTNSVGVFGGYVPNNIELIIEIYDPCGTIIFTSTLSPFTEDVVLDPFNLTVLVDQVIISGSVTACEATLSNSTYVVVDQAEVTSLVSIDSNNEFSANIFYCNNGGEVTVGAIDPVNGIASANSTYTIDGDVDAGNIELCEEYVNQYLYLEYGDQIENLGGSSNVDTSLLFSVSLTLEPVAGAPDTEHYDIIVLNWLTAGIYEFRLTYQEGSPLQPVTIPVVFGGFDASGDVMVQKVEQGGQEYIKASGTLTEINITDSDVYEFSYTELIFHTAIEL